MYRQAGARWEANEVSMNNPAGVTGETWDCPEQTRWGAPLPQVNENVDCFAEGLPFRPD